MGWHKLIILGVFMLIDYVECLHDLFVRNSSLGSGERSVGTWNWEESRRWRGIITLSFIFLGLLAALSASGEVKSKSPYDEKRLLEQKKKMQEANNARENFPNFIREGFQVKAVTSDNYVKRDSGLIYLDIQVGKGDCPKDGQQVQEQTGRAIKFDRGNAKLLDLHGCGALPPVIPAHAFSYQLLV